MKTSLEKKTTLRSFKLYRSYLDPFHLSFFWSLILKDFIQVKKIKGEFVVACSRPPWALAWDQAPQWGQKVSLRTQAYFRWSLLSTRKRVETEKPRLPFPDYRSARFTCLFPNCGACCPASPP